MPDNILGWDHKLGTFVDDGLPDQNIFDAFLRNYDHRLPKYSDVPLKLLPGVKWKMLDYNLFGTVWGKSDHSMELVTNHYSGHNGKVTCWQSGICKLFEYMKGKTPSRADVEARYSCSMRVQRKCKLPHCAEPNSKGIQCEADKCRPPCVGR